MPGKVYNQIYDLAVEEYGYVRTEDLHALGIDIKRLGDLKARGQATRLDVGLYRLKAVPASRYDQYIEAALWHRGLGVLSHAAALDLHDVGPACCRAGRPPKLRAGPGASGAFTRPAAAARAGLTPALSLRRAGPDSTRRGHVSALTVLASGIRRRLRREAVEPCTRPAVS